MNCLLKKILNGCLRYYYHPWMSHLLLKKSYRRRFLMMNRHDRYFGWTNHDRRSYRVIRNCHPLKSLNSCFRNRNVRSFRPWKSLIHFRRNGMKSRRCDHRTHVRL